MIAATRWSSSRTQFVIGCSVPACIETNILWSEMFRFAQHDIPRMTSIETSQYMNQDEFEMRDND